MAESLSSQPVETPTDADAIARKQFDVTRRGFDQNQVRSYLYSVASTIRAGERREAELRERVAAAVRRAHEAEKLDDNTLTERLGEETVRVLTTAREAAEAKIEQADEEAAAILEAAQAEAELVRQQADMVLQERTVEADAAAEAIRDDARAELAKAKELAAAEVEAGRAEAASLLAEAQTVREEVLRDMSRRRQQAKAQVERLRAGRDRILETFDTVQVALDEVRSGVKQSLGEAKVAADIAARRVLDERLPGVDELEAEVETTRMLGLIGPPVSAPSESRAEAEVVSSDGDDAAPDQSDAVDIGAEFESRTVTLDPEVRGGKKLRDQPEVEGEALETVVIGDPEVEEVQVRDEEAQVRDEEVQVEAPVDQYAELEEEAEAVEPAQDAEAEVVEDAGEDDFSLDELFERLRTEQETADDNPTEETADLFEESSVPSPAASPGDVDAEPDAQAETRPDAAAEAAPDAESATDVDAEPEPAPDANVEAEDEPEPVSDPVIAALVATAERRLKRVLADDQNRVLAGLRPKGRRGRQGEPPEQLDIDTQVDLYVEAISAQLEARSEAGGVTDIVAARAVLAESFVAPLREAVEAAVESSEDADENVSAVRAVYRDHKSQISELASALIG